ncbi:MAG TPA: GAF domain-containing protein, partial [Spirochaetia bacterium]|nr:GAF domain-containing protein [Spirochaetia bacterium]
MLLFSTVVKLAALLSYLVLVLLILRSKAERDVRVFFSIYLFGMLFWQTTSVMVNFSQDAKTALLWYNLLLAGSGTFNILFFPFTRAFAKIKGQKFLTGFAYVACAALLGSGALGIQFQEVTLGKAGYWVPIFNRWSYVMALVSYFFWGFGISNLVRGLIHEKSPVHRNRLVYVLLGGCVVLIGATSNLTFLQDYPFDICMNLASALIIGYAVIRFRLLEIRVILVRSLFYSVLTVGGIAAYLGIVFGVERILKLGIGYSGPLYPIIAILVIAIVFLPFRNGLQKGLDRVFFREKADYQNATQVFSRDITSLYDASDILSLVATTLSQTVKVGTLTIAVLDAENQVFRAEKSIGSRTLAKSEVLFGVGSNLVQWLRHTGQPLVREEAELNPDSRPIVEENRILFEIAGTSVVVPILLRDKLLGALNLGPKRAGTMYSRDDLRFLTTIANQTATALEKTSAYREIQRRLSEQTLLFILSERFRGTTDFDSIMQSVVRILKSFLACDYCALVYHETAAGSKVFALDPLSTVTATVVSEAQNNGGMAPNRGQDPFPLGEKLLGEIRRRS